MNSFLKNTLVWNQQFQYASCSYAMLNVAMACLWGDQPRRSERFRDGHCPIKKWCQGFPTKILYRYAFSRCTVNLTPFALIAVAMGTSWKSSSTRSFFLAQFRALCWLYRLHRVERMYSEIVLPSLRNSPIICWDQMRTDGLRAKIWNQYCL